MAKLTQGSGSFLSNDRTCGNMDHPDQTLLDRAGMTGFLSENSPTAQLTVVANITAKADKIDPVKAELEKLIPLTRTEEGCINYDLHQDNENPALFMFYENWEFRELWQAHMGNKHLQDYMAATEGAVEEFTLNKMTQIA